MDRDGAQAETDGEIHLENQLPVRPQSWDGTKSIGSGRGVGMIYKSDRLLYLKCSDMEDIINLYVDVYLQTNPVKLQQK